MATEGTVGGPGGLLAWGRYAVIRFHVLVDMAIAESKRAPSAVRLCLAQAVLIRAEVAAVSVAVDWSPYRIV